MSSASLDTPCGQIVSRYLQQYFALCQKIESYLFVRFLEAAWHFKNDEISRKSYPLRVTRHPHPVRMQTFGHTCLVSIHRTKCFLPSNSPQVSAWNAHSAFSPLASHQKKR